LAAFGTWWKALTAFSISAPATSMLRSHFILAMTALCAHIHSAFNLKQKKGGPRGPPLSSANG
jgi:hypothetical protein